MAAADGDAGRGWSSIQGRVAADAELVAAGVLQSACAAFCAAAAEQPVRGMVLLLHGFTAGPWQYRPLAAHLGRAGLHVYAARLPGHGAYDARGYADHTQLPKSAQAQLYAACAVQAFTDVAAVASGERIPLFVVGFSAGAALAIDIVQRFGSHIARGVLISPLIRFYGRLRRTVFHALRLIPGAGRLTDRMCLTWRDPPLGPAGWVRPGHAIFSLGNVQGLAAYAARVAPPAGGLAVPCQFIMTACDAKVELAAGVALARCGGHPLWCFPRSAKLAHAMLTPEENPDAESRNTIYGIVEDFLLFGRGHERAPAP